jgi:D-tagatose-1,6-bisphosphate aldolase subunit GatZ/KbaZ
LRAAAEQAREDGALLLIEATSNQVNQAGGYTGMTPADFRLFAERIVADADFDPARLILGGDHLGPNVWRAQDAESAMASAAEMVSQYVAAGFTKIHLDTSMPCAGEGAVLPDEIIASRAARLCVSAEAAAGAAGFSGPLYVIGTEVPTPGGATHELDHLAVTSTEAAQKTLDVHQREFTRAGVQSGWDRVLALVVQPGLEFGHDNVIEYSRAEAAPLTEWLRHQPGKQVFEAHSTDYQPAKAYVQLVQDGFAILKVGPALTFALREALFALAAIEFELVSAGETSMLREVVEQSMLDHPAACQPYYSGSAEAQRRLRTYSYSDRMRYYWNRPEVQASVDCLVINLSKERIPQMMLSAYLPAQYKRVRDGVLENSPEALIIDKIRDVLRGYAAAC